MGTAYNNFECANDPNVFKTVISSFVFSADFPAKQYLIGSRVRSNTEQYFCGNNNLDSLSYVPAWYSSNSTTATNTNTVTNNDVAISRQADGPCVCDGPQEEDVVSSYNELLVADGVVASTTTSSDSSSIVITGVEQLCVAPTRITGASEITFNAAVGFVYL